MSDIPLEGQFLYELIGFPKKDIAPNLNLVKAERLFKELGFPIQERMLSNKNPVLEAFHSLFEVHGPIKFGNKKTALAEKKRFLKKLQIIFKLRAVEEKRKGAKVTFEGPSAAAANAQVRKQPKKAKKKLNLIVNVLVKVVKNIRNVVGGKVKNL